MNNVQNCGSCKVFKTSYKFTLINTYKQRLGCNTFSIKTGKFSSRFVKGLYLWLGAKPWRRTEEWEIISVLTFNKHYGMAE
jgi:hypothetical protein